MAPASEPIVCPVCRVPLPKGTTLCPDCGEDLAAIVYLQRQADVLYNAGLCAAQAGDLDRAIRQLEQSAELGKTSTTLGLLGKLYSQRGQRDRARDAWQEALQIAPECEAAQEGLSYFASLEADEARGAEQVRLTQLQLRADERRRARIRWALQVVLSFAVGVICFWALQRFWVGTTASDGRPTQVAVAEISLSPVPTDTPTSLPPSRTPAPEAVAPTVTPPASPEPKQTAAPTATTQPTVAPPPTPTRDLRGPAQVALQAQGGLDARRIRVEQSGNTVSLVGDVPSLLSRYQIELAVRRALGTVPLDLQHLTVAQTHAVKGGDTLWGISNAMYGTPLRWKDIADANNLESPYWVPVGQELRIPLP